jgi:hypothetical protein
MFYWQDEYEDYFGECLGVGLVDVVDDGEVGWIEVWGDVGMAVMEPSVGSV